MSTGITRRRSRPAASTLDQNLSSTSAAINSGSRMSKVRKVEIPAVVQNVSAMAELNRQLAIAKVQQSELQKELATARLRETALRNQLQAVKVQINNKMDDLYQSFIQGVERQLNCCICSEVFIRATIVDCGHTFCSYCISEWCKEKSDCPVCRSEIENSSKVVELENYIVSFYELLSPEVQRKRAELLKIREEVVNPKKPVPETPMSVPPATNQAGSSWNNGWQNGDSFAQGMLLMGIHNNNG